MWKLDTACCSFPIFMYNSNEAGPFIMTTNYSIIGMNAILSQVQQGQEKMCCLGNSNHIRRFSPFLAHKSKLFECHTPLTANKTHTGPLKLEEDDFDIAKEEPKDIQGMDPEQCQI